MTFDEWWLGKYGIPPTKHHEDYHLAVEAWEVAQTSEREACAKIAEAYSEVLDGLPNAEALEIAHGIRSREKSLFNAAHPAASGDAHNFANLPASGADISLAIMDAARRASPNLAGPKTPVRTLPPS